MKNFFVFLLCSIPSLVIAVSFTTWITPASVRSGEAPFEFEVTEVPGGVDILFSSSLPEDNSVRVRTYLASVELTGPSEDDNPPRKGESRKISGQRTHRLRDIDLQKKDGKAFAKFHIESELLKEVNLSLVYETSRRGEPVAGFRNFHIAWFLRDKAEQGGAR